MNLQSLFHQLPREQFITNILVEFNSNSNSLERIRDLVFKTLTSIKEYPYSEHVEMKKRKATRRGDSLEYKLASDIHTLTSVLDGASFDDLKDLLSMTKATSLERKKKRLRQAQTTLK